MSVYVSEQLRKTVTQRAKHLCEYCLFHEEDALNTFHIEHIIPLKHNGKTIFSNLAYACPFCNNFKGTNIGTYLNNDQVFVPLYHPRQDIWSEHFFLSGFIIEPLTKIGEATINILCLNEEKRLLERSLLQEIGRYPGVRFEEIVGGNP